jgi:hypothetical protein
LADKRCFRGCSRFLLWLNDFAVCNCSRFCGLYFGFQPASGIKILGYCDTECRRPVLRPLVRKPVVKGEVDAEAGFARYILVILSHVLARFVKGGPRRVEQSGGRRGVSGGKGDGISAAQFTGTCCLSTSFSLSEHRVWNSHSAHSKCDQNAS